ncbi:MAG: response regulator transcription factor [Burkholderiales bacterium]|nr:response regulator transcription factor [Burkholderiales bacterium]
MGSIYLVDGYVMFREAFRAVLSGKGHTVVGESDNPTQALSDIQRLSPDVVLLDLNLGARSGLELLLEMQQRRLSSRVIVLAMAAHPQHVLEAVRLGVHGYVLQRNSLDVLLHAVSTVLAGQRYFMGEVADLMAEALSQPAHEMPLSALSSRERQVLLMVVRGHTSSAIGESLHLSSKTVDSYRSRLMSKLGVSDVPALVRLAIREGLIDVDEA